MDAQNFPDCIQYVYEQDREAVLKIAHGVWGGANPHGEIEMCFYDETSIPPRHSTQAISPDGAPGPEKFADDAQGHIQRRIHTKVLLNYHTARAVMEWLEDRLSELEEQAPAEIYNGNTGICQ